MLCLVPAAAPTTALPTSASTRRGDDSSSGFQFVELWPKPGQLGSQLGLLRAEHPFGGQRGGQPLEGLPGGLRGGLLFLGGLLLL